MSDLIALPKLRRVLDTDAEGLTDTELTEYREQLYGLAHVILNAYDEFSTGHVELASLDLLPPEVVSGIMERMGFIDSDEHEYAEMDYDESDDRE